MALDLIFLVILTAMIALGAWRGAVASGSGLLSLVAGYVGAIAAASFGSDWAARVLTLSPLLAPAVAGSLGFFVTWLFVSALAGIGVALDAERAELGRGPIDRALGGFFGLARGSLIVVLLAVLTSWLDAARDLGAVDGLAAVPDAQTSTFADVSGTLVESAVSKAFEGAGPAGEMAARLTAHPGKTLGSAQAIIEDPRMTEVFSDELFWTLIQNESVDYAMNRGPIHQIVADPTLRGRLADLGLVSDEARTDSKVFRAAMAEVMTEIAPTVERLHKDPELQALGQDPEIVSLIESGNTLALINHPKIQRIVERMTAEI